MSLWKRLHLTYKKADSMVESWEGDSSMKLRLLKLLGLAFDSSQQRSLLCNPVCTICFVSFPQCTC